MRQRTVLEVGAACVALMALVRFIYQPLLGTLQERRATLRDLRVKIADAQGLADRMPMEEAALRQTKERHRALEERIDKKQSVARVIEMLRTQAKDRELQLSAVQPRPKPDALHTFAFGSETTLRETLLTLQVSGRYQRIGQFLGTLLDQPFLVCVRNVTLTKPANKGQDLQAELSLAVYMPERSATHELVNRDDSRS